MEIRRVVIVTGNQNKLREMREILRDLEIEVVSSAELSAACDVEETGKSFAENAMLKARSVEPEMGDLVIADDSGLAIDALGGAPGIYSARFMGEDTPSEEKNEGILDMLKDVPVEKRGARFVCAIAGVTSEGETIEIEETMEGRIADEPAGENGFGYDPIFYLPEYGATSAQIAPEEKNRISHRGKALAKLEEIIRLRAKVNTNS